MCDTYLYREIAENVFVSWSLYSGWRRPPLAPLTALRTARRKTSGRGTWSGIETLVISKARLLCHIYFLVVLILFEDHYLDYNNRTVYYNNHFTRNVKFCLVILLLAWYTYNCHFYAVIKLVSVRLFVRLTILLSECGSSGSNVIMDHRC